MLPSLGRAPAGVGEGLKKISTPTPKKNLLRGGGWVGLVGIQELLKKRAYKGVGIQELPKKGRGVGRDWVAEFRNSRKRSFGRDWVGNPGWGGWVGLGNS